MKDFFRNFKIPIIFGGCALIAIIATLIVVTGGFSSKYGLYITSAYGSVSVTNSDVVTTPASGDALKEGDIITVGSGASCTIAYKGKKNSENNYLVIGPESQIVVSGAFDGKIDGELFLRNGTVIANFADEDHSSINIRTADSMITTKNSVSKISYYTNEFMSYTDLYTFMGNSQIQLYDTLGNAVNNAEMQIQKKWGRVVSENGPSFEALNLEIDLNELTAFDLKTLITIATLVGEEFPYTTAELKAVYDTKADDGGEGISVEEQVTETTASVSEPTDNSDTIQTAEPIVTTAPPPTETTLPNQKTTTAPPATTTAQKTTTETTAASSDPTVYHIVTIVIDGEETIQEVPHGGNAVKPEDPKIDGLTFIGWDSSFENITEDTIIMALFDEFDNSVDPDDPDNVFTDYNPDDAIVTHVVTVVIGNKSNTILVEHGTSANLPLTLEIEGYVFKGWDKDFTNITADTTITAILEANTHTVTFVVEQQSFAVEVENGGSVVPPYIPVSDSNGNKFVGWDRALNNIVMDTTITAMFADDNIHVVTFIIDGQFYNVNVEHGGTATPPFMPITDSNGNPFIFWSDENGNVFSDSSGLTNITRDARFTAIYG